MFMCFNFDATVFTLSVGLCFCVLPYVQTVALYPLSIYVNLGHMYCYVDTLDKRSHV